MNPRLQHGFTIIETMLFLAVTGALVVGILAGSGTMIAQQRYKDAVISLQDVLQEQYTKVANVVNDERTTGLKCNTGDATVSEDAVGAARGASECVILGRFIQFRDNGTTIETSNIIGALTPGVTPAENDIDALKQYHLARSPVGKEVTSVAWGAEVVRPGPTHQPYNAIILLLRSPFSGSIRTFISADSINSEALAIPSSMMNEFNKVETLCVSPSGFSMGETLGVKIQPAAAGPSAIEQVAKDSGC